MEILYTLALSKVKLNLKQKVLLYTTLGSATAVFEQRKLLRESKLDFSPKVVAALENIEELLPCCEAELEYAQKHKIQVLGFGDEAYPVRLKECVDAPLVLHYLGNADLNAKHIISVVGTRQCTERGKDWCKHFIQDLSQHLPDTLVMSGLAYGIDIAAHRACLENNISTVGVLAHGLDEIYPSLHRQTAAEMVQKGGLLTEFPPQTPIDKMNFVQRNRIVAGMADATIVVESSAKGGSLITAGLANDYHRNVFAVPGRVTDKVASGCNALIRNNVATLITSAEDMLLDLGWESQQKEGIQRELFPELSSEEEKIVALMKAGGEDISLAYLLQETQLEMATLMPLMMTLEMKGIVKTLAGMKYHLLAQ